MANIIPFINHPNYHSAQSGNINIGEAKNGALYE
jgi:hypothetical protein